MNAELTLVEFLRARLLDDEQAAQQASTQGPARWHPARDGASWHVDDPSLPIVGWEVGTPGYLQAEHIARHDPARVLADVEAARRLIHLLNGAGWYIAEEIREHAMRLLALPYAGHPDYRAEEWAP